MTRRLMNFNEVYVILISQRYITLSHTYLIGFTRQSTSDSAMKLNRLFNTYDVLYDILIKYYEFVIVTYIIQVCCVTTYRLVVPCWSNFRVPSSKRPKE